MHFRNVTIVVGLLLVTLLPAGPHDDATTPPQGIRDKTPGLTVFTHATLVVSPTETIENGTLVVRDGRIVAAGRRASIPDGAAVHDLGGRTIYAGFVDPFTEYGLAEVGPLNGPWPGPKPKVTGTRIGANAWNDAIHAERDWIDAFRPDEEAAEPFLKRGVTVVQSAKLDGIFRGRAFVTTLAPGLANDVVLRPRTAHFASFDKGSSHQDYPSSQMGSIAIVRQTLLDAGWYERAHSAYALDPGQSMPELNRAAAALTGDTPFVFETGDELELLRAARIASELSLEFVHVGSNTEFERIEAIAALGRPIILPVDYPPAPRVGSIEDRLEVSLAELRRWEGAAGNAAVLAAHDVPFAFTAHRLKKDQDFLKNVREAVGRGLPAETALAALTTEPARLCGIADRVGTLESGKLANLVVTDGDILDERTRIESVWIEGRLVKQYHALHEIDFRGTYELQLEGRSYELSLREWNGHTKGGLTSGEESATVKLAGRSASELTLYADLEPFGIPGVAEIVLSAQPDGSLSARVTLADGRRSELAVERKIDEKLETDQNGKKAGATETVARRTRPNIAFGFDDLPQREDLLVRDATIWTSGPQGTLEHADLLVVDGKIAAVGTGLDAPRGTRVLDGTGKHLTAGIIDEHSHITISGGGNEGTHSVSAEVRIGDILNPDDIAIYRALAGGATTAQILHGSANPIGGQAQVIKLRWGADTEGLKFRAAPPTIKFALGENVKQSNWGEKYTLRYPQSRMGVETIMKDNLIAAREYKLAHEAWEALDAAEQERTIPPRRDLRLDALAEVLDGERFVHCHSYVQSEILMLMQLAEQLGFRIQTFTHILEGYKVAQEMAAHGAGASTFADWWAYKFEVYDAIPYNTCLLHERGVVTSVNSDSSDLIRRLNQDAAKSVMYCGMDEQEAWKLVTLNPAIQLRIDDRVGSLEAGKDADFVIWNGHPMSIYSSVEQTWIDGMRLFDLERDAAAREADATEKRALTQRAMQSVLQKPGPGSGLGNGEE